MPATSLFRNQTVSCTTSATTTEQVPIGEMKQGTVFIPTGSLITSLTFHGAPTVDGTFLPLYDAAKAALAQTSLTAARAYQIPTAAFGAAAIKIVTDAAGDVDVSLKS